MENQQFPWRKEVGKKPIQEPIMSNQHMEELRIREERQRQGMYKDNVRPEQRLDFDHMPQREPQRPIERQPQWNPHQAQQKPYFEPEGRPREWDYPPRQPMPQPQQPQRPVQPQYPQYPQQRSVPQQSPQGMLRPPLPPPGLQQPPKKSKKRVMLYVLFGVLAIVFVLFIISLITFFARFGA